MNFARSQIEADIRERRDAAETLAYASCDKQRYAIFGGRTGQLVSMGIDHDNDGLPSTLPLVLKS